ncbi:MAG TPA: hypothetical protein DEQ74_00805 [Wolbachia sp.]|jgi:F0F1-type ATP synthase assembly protein I|uniref:hypothetical protein n=1 Tax=Wolbachia endosymbiont of Pentalonia nigronervosa TaxID=1301914 RepID=UPI000EDE894E|nr:hypothetical protein [Wolbachia endosymbiont of Pentalonia nigronervosa]MBD0391725.1 hypothetical protein [Wolbachia endosymbiont of Pentalonia nigronervosa]HCE59364.1 hypothetical protein [Wolbachia sp.]
MTTIRGTRAVPETQKTQAFNAKRKKATKEKGFKKEHQQIYDAFLRALKSDELDPRGKAVATFLYDNTNNIFNDVDLKRIELLSKENFCQFLLAVFKGIKAGNLADEENLKNGKVQALIDKCITNACGTEVKDSFIKLLGVPIGVEIDPKNVASSVKKGVLNKIPFLGNKEEKNEPAKSDVKLVADALAKVLLPIFLFIVTAMFIEVSQTMIIFAVIGLIFATCKAISSLFADTRNQGNAQEDLTDWEGKIIEGINKTLPQDLEKQLPGKVGKKPHITQEEERRKNNSPGYIIS